jgi:hypothetical protein
LRRVARVFTSDDTRWAEISTPKRVVEIPAPTGTGFTCKRARVANAFAGGL